MGASALNCTFLNILLWLFFFISSSLETQKEAKERGIIQQREQPQKKDKRKEYKKHFAIKEVKVKDIDNMRMTMTEQ